jgi:hypothetical protein
MSNWMKPGKDNRGQGKLPMFKEFHNHCKIIRTFTGAI